MPRCSFTFGQIEELLAKAHRIDPAKRTAFQGRLKHLQRWGFPSGTKPGKGKAIGYTAEHVYMMVLALELIQAGMPPKLSADLVRDNWNELRVTTYLNLFSEVERRAAGSAGAGDWCWLFRPEALREITAEGLSEYDHYEAVQTIELSGLAAYLSAESEAFGGELGRSWRTLVINGGPLVRGIALLIESEFGWATTANLRQDLLEANEQAAEALQAGLQAVQNAIEGFMLPQRAMPPVAERYPAQIVDMALKAIDMHRSLLERLNVPDGQAIELQQDELLELRDAGVLAVEMEGLVLTEKGQLIREILQEEGGNGEHS